MAKKDKPRKGASNQNKQSPTRSRKSRNIHSSPSTKWNQFSLYGTISVLAIFILWFIYFHDNNHENNNIQYDPTVPHIDGVAMELDYERGNATQHFLDNFVCNYQPKIQQTDENTAAVDIKGYCHPRLIAIPHHRTQKVSKSISKDVQTTLLAWWKKILRQFTSNKHELVEDHGIAAGELVMRLPRPLQIWDLDALRDGFIQQEFLGFNPNGSGSNTIDKTDSTSQNSNKKIARHKDTQNPLDSGSYLAVYLIRLLHGSQRVGMSSHDDSNAGQCQSDDDGECKLLQNWGDVDQHKQRIQILSDYLDMLPTVADRRARSTPTQRINPHSHPLFWSQSTLTSMFPRYTHTYDLIRHYQQMIESEYEALKQVSEEFGTNVQYSEYLNMRINVLSRAFGVQASAIDNGAKWDVSNDNKRVSLVEEMRSYETSNFGSYLENEDTFKLRSMCPLLDMYNSHPNPNVVWRYDSKTSSYAVHAEKSSNISGGHSIVVSYGTYTDGHLFTKFGYLNGDGSSPTEVSLAVFHRLLGDVGLGRQYSQLPFNVWDPSVREDVFGSLLNDTSTKVDADVKKGLLSVVAIDTEMKKSLVSAKQALNMQAKELLRYLIFDDGYKECLDLTVSSGSSDEEELKLLKLRHLVRLANYRQAWTVRVPPKFPDARPFQNLGSSARKDQKTNSVGVNAHRILSICRLLSLRVDDIGGDAIGYLRGGLDSDSPHEHFLPEKHEETLEYRSMMCVVRLCNAALGRYIGYDKDEPETVGSIEWNAWYIISGEVRALGILQQTVANEANKLKHRYYQSTENADDEAMQIREEGACPLEYSLPLLKRL